MSEPDSRHGPIAQLLISWAPLSVILLVYAAAQWVSGPITQHHDDGANRLGFSLHVSGPARVDEAVFGVVPSVWLQQRLVDGSTHWYDAVAALVYVTHFVSIPLVTAWVWFRVRDRFRAWIAAVLVFTVVGVSGYVVYPAAPPWLASQQDQIGQVDRISRFGWHFLQLDPIARLSGLGQGESNPVAAMPSLHAGAALLVTLFLWPSVTRWWRAALGAYVVLMALTLVYTGEHYVVDVVAGWLTAGIAVAAGAATRRRSPPERSGAADLAESVDVSGR
ncbi:phosphatase PAP2 family protein [Nocardioides sp. URHA0020]|uniref:phosphatase PAP2 family protein n=1 Tax=Nocardioides sp. URHA0020 TaxID=1380392 RepID=UPI0006861C27|nr:phosphatase PAP2 family protein [Nocardioides sp. URHA0020]